MGGRTALRRGAAVEHELDALKEEGTILGDELVVNGNETSGDKNGNPSAARLRALYNFKCEKSPTKVPIWRLAG